MSGDAIPHDGGVRRKLMNPTSKITIRETTGELVSYIIRVGIDAVDFINT